MPEVAFCREIHPGNRGEDVVAHKRALSRWNPHVYPWPKDGNFTDFAGPFFWTALYEYKRQHGLLSQKEREHKTALVLGTGTHTAMEKSVCHFVHAGQPAFDARAIQLAEEFCRDFRKTPEDLGREAGVSALLYWYAHRMVTAYSQYRPFPVLKPPAISNRWDCSGCATNGHYVGGFPDPNGLGYSGEGYTGTQIDHGIRVSHLSELKPLDLIFYGSSSGRPGFRYGDPTHVATYVGKISGVESVVSMGHYPMSLYAYNYRSINQMRHYPFR
jgi:hypothetical protein